MVRTFCHPECHSTLVLVRIEARSLEEARARESALAWLAANASDSADVPSDFVASTRPLSVRRAQEGRLTSPAVYFADTSFWIALSQRPDQHHRRASEWSRHLDQQDTFILATEAVLWEWMNALAGAGTRRTTAEGFRRCHQDPQIEVVPIAPTPLPLPCIFVRHEATRLEPHRLPVVSGTEERRLPRALTTDRHFQQQVSRQYCLWTHPGPVEFLAKQNRTARCDSA